MSNDTNEDADTSTSIDNSNTNSEEVCMCNSCSIGMCTARGLKTGYCGNFTNYQSPYNF